MSILETPRIYFKGEIAWDPITTNNYPQDYNETVGEAIYPAAADAADKVLTFRQQAIQQITTMGNWNPHGTHRAKFFSTVVHGCDFGAGLDITDPIISVPVSLQAMLVDLEPYGGQSSQLFFDTMQFGVQGGCRILAPRMARFTARYINMSRNSVNAMIAGVASVVWQTSLAKWDGLCIDAFDSAVLQSLEEVLQDDNVLGLTVRFNTYRTVYFDTIGLRNRSAETTAKSEALAAKLTAGGFQPNPARSLLVGTVGLWRKGEPVHEPGDRALIRAGSNSPVGSAQFRVTDTTLTLDLSNSVMEISEDLRKMDLGPLTLGIPNANGSTANVARLDYAKYDRVAYEATAGIVSLPLLPGTAARAAAEDIQFFVGSVPLLSEQSVRAIPEIPNLYINEGDNTTLSFHVYERGLSAKAGVAVTIYAFDMQGNPLSTAQLTTDANGLVSIPLIGVADGVTVYVASFSDSDKPAGSPDAQINTYMYVRVLPSDAEIAALEPTWTNVYGKVLANWNAMAPCMDNWLRLDNPEQIRRFADILKQLTDPAAMERYRFMPVTRDMSAGKRALLYRFLDAPIAENTERIEELLPGERDASPKEADKPAIEGPKLPRRIQQNRNMRNSTE